jgi:hypothetical protein
LSENKLNGAYSCDIFLLFYAPEHLICKLGVLYALIETGNVLAVSATYFLYCNRSRTRIEFE